jgi:hypothetical protein
MQTLSQRQVSLAQWQHVGQVVTEKKGRCVLVDSDFDVLNKMYEIVVGFRNCFYE